MKLIDPSVQFMVGAPYDVALSAIEIAGRTCYKSEDKITDNSSVAFIERIIRQYQHESVIEHMGFTLKFFVDRAVSHEMVRQRLCSFSQESQRYVDLNGKDIEFIRPYWLNDNCDTVTLATFLDGLQHAEDSYKALRAAGLPPQAARGVLPNATKTEIVTTANMRQWRHVFKLRCDKAAHPDMVLIMRKALAIATEKYPVFFEDLKFE